MLTMELGQMMHGNPTGEYGTAEWVDALIEALISEAERVYWNVNQEEWDRYSDPKIKGLEFRPYYWGDDEKEAALPNLKFTDSPQEIRWYKHIGRSMTASESFTIGSWISWFNHGMAIIRAADSNDVY